LTGLVLDAPRRLAVEWPRAAKLAATVVVLVLVVVRSILALGAAGSEMDEGDSLVYGDRVGHGDLPWRDFETFYGPANPYLIQVAYRVFGTDVFAERLVALGFRLVLVAALLTLAWRFDIVGFLASAAATLVLVPATDLFAWPGIEVVAVLAAELVVLARRHALAAGALAAFAVLVRWDYAPAALLAAVPFVLRRDVSWKRFGAAFVAVAALYVPILVAAHARLAQVAGDIARGADGRKLPIPSPSSYPGNVLRAGLIAVAFLVVVGAIAFFRRGDLRQRILLGAGLASVGSLPHVLSRPERTHVIAGTILPLTLFPLLVSDGVRRLSRRVAMFAVLGIAVVALDLAAILSTGQLRPLFRPQPAPSATIRHAGRSFPLRDPVTAAHVQSVVDAAARSAPRGSRLFVGPRDLRRTNYADTYVYFLLPEFRPASFYVELEPGTLNENGARAVAELRNADLLILTTLWDEWNEPNTSREYGSPAPNRFVASHFCETFRKGEYALFVRRDANGRCD
jgi:hypothetical protein